jgi:hypothetical protein
LLSLAPIAIDAPEFDVALTISDDLLVVSVQLVTPVEPS